MKTFKSKQAFAEFIFEQLNNKGYTVRCVKASWDRWCKGGSDTGAEKILVNIDLERVEVEYLVYYPFKLDKNNLTFANVAVAYLNEKRKEHWYAHDTFICDIEKRKIGIKTKFFLDKEKTAFDTIYDQLGTITKAYDFLYDSLEDGLIYQDAEDYKSELCLYSALENFSFYGMEACFENAVKAVEKYGSVATRFKNNVVVKFNVGQDEKRAFPLSFNLRMDPSVKHGIALMHALPSGFVLEDGVDVAIATNYLNNKIEYGRFDVDLFRGRAYYHVVIDPVDVELSKETFEKAYEMVIQTLSKYYLIYVNYLKGKYTNKEYMTLVEANKKTRR